MAIEPTEIDARGLKCPLPVLKAEKALANMPAGGTLILWASDPMAKVDIPLYCHKNNYAFTLTQGECDMRFEITKSS